MGAILAWQYFGEKPTTFTWVYMVCINRGKSIMGSFLSAVCLLSNSKVVMYVKWYKWGIFFLPYILQKHYLACSLSSLTLSFFLSLFLSISLSLLSLFYSSPLFSFSLLLFPSLLFLSPSLPSPSISLTLSPSLWLSPLSLFLFLSLSLTFSRIPVCSVLFVVYLRYSILKYCVIFCELLRVNTVLLVYLPHQ